MIRINLSKNLVVGAIDEGAVELNTDSSSQKKAIVNVLIFLIFPLLVKGYEMVQESQIKKENAALNSTLRAKRQEVEASGQTSQLVEKLMREKAELDLHLSQIAEISIERILPLKTLDALPTLIPDRTWINTLELSDGPISTSQNRGGAASGTADATFKMRLEAYSLNPDGAALFMRAFDESIFFDETRMESTTRETSPLGDVSKFALEVRIREGY